MCGFIGAFRLDGCQPPDIPLCPSEEALLALRGPDEVAEFGDAASRVRFHRLRTLSAERRLSELQFPSAISFCLLNGTLHRWRELDPDSATDHEALAWAFNREKCACFSRLIGAFACCIKTTESLVLATDSVGEKSLCWIVYDGVLWFSTSPLLLAIHLRREPVSKKGVLLHLSLRGQPLGKTYFKGINQLRPGCVLTAGRSGLSIASFPQPARFVRSLSVKDFRDALAEKMKDGRTGIALSGGVDSSLLAVVGSTDAGIKVCASITGEGDTAFAEDWRQADNLVKGMEGVELLNVPADSCMDLSAPRDFPVLDQDEHSLDAIAWTLRRATCNTLASGDGADELFCGYDRIYRFGIAMDAGNIPWNEAKRLFIDRYTYLDLAVVKTRLGAKVGQELQDSLTHYLEDLCLPSPTRFRMVYSWFLRHHLFWLLRKLDFVSGRHGLESRTPYLHPLIVRFATNLPDDKLVSYVSQNEGSEGFHRQVKSALKDLLGHLVGDSILCRPKQPFPLREAEAQAAYNKILGSETPAALSVPLHEALLQGEAGSYCRLLYLSYLCWLQTCRNLTI